jgi:hypothetical protein
VLDWDGGRREGALDTRAVAEDFVRVWVGARGLEMLLAVERRPPEVVGRDNAVPPAVEEDDDGGRCRGWIRRDGGAIVVPAGLEGSTLPTTRSGGFFSDTGRPSSPETGLMLLVAMREAGGGLTGNLLGETLRASVRSSGCCWSSPCFDSPAAAGLRRERERPRPPEAADDIAGRSTDGVYLFVGEGVR